VRLNEDKSRHATAWVTRNSRANRLTNAKLNRHTRQTGSKKNLIHNDGLFRLSLACGTGIVARKARQKIGHSARVVGVDLNEGMIATARGLTDENARSCEWHFANVTDLSFDDQSFTMAFCRQGFQFFPDTLTAMREIHRLLRPKGRLAITVWAGPSDFVSALADALRDNIGEEVAQQSLAPFAFGDIDKLIAVMEQAGFGGITSQLLTVNRTLSTQEAIEKEIMGNPIGVKVAEHGEAVMSRIVFEVAQAISEYCHGRGFVVPQKTRLLQAYVG
jgi:ubiquinone/menaquinone biosynthesis C-methylase UbiE